jgi:hypothetical protein
VEWSQWTGETVRAELRTTAWTANQLAQYIKVSVLKMA